MYFSIIVPMFNLEHYIKDCCLSIQNQFFEDFEVILVDDESTDNTEKVVEDLVGDDDRFKFYRKPNGGAADTRNYGIKKANGKYILFVDGDDYIDADMLQKLYDLTKGKEYDILEFNAMVQQDGRNLGLYNDRYQPYSEMQDGLNYMINNLKNYGNIYIVPWGKLIRRNLIIENSIYFKKGRLYEDELWTPQLFIHAKKVNYIDLPVYHYKLRNGSSMHSQLTEKNLSDSRKNFQELEKYYNKLEVSHTKKAELKSYIAREYMWACTNYSIGRLSFSDRKFVFRNAKNPQSIIESILFNISPSLRKNIINLIKKKSGRV